MTLRLGTGLAPRVGFAAAVALAALAAAGTAAACVCPDGSMKERLDAADAAVVARLVDSKEALSSTARRILTFEVEQRVKGDLGRRVDVRSPSGTDCDLEVHEAQTIGLLLTRMPSGEWLGTQCGVVDPGELVAAGGEPRGGTIKVGIGIVILGLVLLLASYRLRRGLRPQLPGAPR